MEIIKFDDPLAFQRQVQAYLVRYEAENNLLLGILANMIGGEYRENTVYMALVRDGNSILTAALATAPYPVLISYENPPPGEAVMAALLADIQSRLGEEFSGLSGNKEFVTPLVQLWEKSAGREASLEMAMRIYKLDKVRPVTGVTGRMRPAEGGDRGLLLDWYAGFLGDAMEEDPDPGQVRRQVDAYLQNGPDLRGLMIWEKEGKPVSMAGYAGPTPGGIRVGAVYTPPDQRRKGYASACTAGLSQYLLDRGFQFCFLFTDLLNPTSNHIYQQIGYQPVCDVDRYRF